MAFWANFCVARKNKNNHMCDSHAALFTEQSSCPAIVAMLLWVYVYPNLNKKIVLDRQKPRGFF